MKLSQFPQQLALKCIRFYQATLSPDHSPKKKYFPYGYCPFTPSCSMYGYQAIEKYGFLKGSFKIAWRILRCNPFTKGGHDEP
jgi:putative membrane protein insertion efficiency factor